MEERNISIRYLLRRYFAFWIDCFVMLIIVMFPLLIIFSLRISTEVPYLEPSIFIFALILIVLRDIYMGISVGKWICGLMVRNKYDYSVPSTKTLILRNLIVPFFIKIIIEEYYKKNSKNFGDNIFNALVLINPNKASKKKRIVFFILIFTLFCLCFCFYNAVRSLPK